MTPVRRWVVAAAALALVAPVSGCAGKRAKAGKERTAEFLFAQDVYDRAQVELGRRNLRKARQLLEKVQYTAEDRTRLEPLVRVALADSMFYLGDDLSLIEARAKYQDFVTLNGNHPLAPYAGFQAGVCSLKQVRAPSRDQTETRLAIGDLRDVLRRWPESRFALASRDAITQAEANLAENEFQIGRFYLQKRRYGAAAERFRRLNENYPLYAEKDRLYFHLGKALYMSTSPAEGLVWFDRLSADYPQSRYAKDAKAFLAREAAKDRPRGSAKKDAPKLAEPSAPASPAPEASKGREP